MAKQKEAVHVKHWDAKLSHKVIHTVVTIVITLGLTAAGAYAYFFYGKDTQAAIYNSPPTVKTIAGASSNSAKFDEPLFSFELPNDWKKTGELTTGPTHKFSYQATLKNQDNRFLDIYMDQLPLTMAVNREVAVHANDQNISHGVVSDNCTTFTTQTSPNQWAVPAKWDGVDFLCDWDTKSRNLVGTSSPGGLNKLELRSIDGMKHNFFFVYTDHNFTPEYSIFYNMLDSFVMK